MTLEAFVVAVVGFNLIVVIFMLATTCLSYDLIKFNRHQLEINKSLIERIEKLEKSL